MKKLIATMLLVLVSGSASLFGVEYANVTLEVGEGVGERVEFLYQAPGSSEQQGLPSVYPGKTKDAGIVPVGAKIIAEVDQEAKGTQPIKTNTLTLKPKAHFIVREDAVKGYVLEEK